MDRFKVRKSLAGTLQPGDGTRYEIVAVKNFDTIDVVILNDAFFDKVTFLIGVDEHYNTFRGGKTNPWTIKAAEEMRDRLIKGESK